MEAAGERRLFQTSVAPRAAPGSVNADGGAVVAKAPAALHTSDFDRSDELCQRVLGAHLVGASPAHSIGSEWRSSAAIHHFGYPGHRINAAAASALSSRGQAGSLRKAAAAKRKVTERGESNGRKHTPGAQQARHQPPRSLASLTDHVVCACCRRRSSRGLGSRQGKGVERVRSPHRLVARQRCQAPHTSWGGGAI